MKILLGGFVLFMAASIVQERDFFASVWFGRETPGPSLGEEQKKGASDAVYLHLKMISHLYGSGGDTRFAERVVAVPAVVEETLSEVAYLKRNHRVMDPVLMKLEVIEVTPLGEGVEVRTREFWITRTFWEGSDRESDPVRSEVVFAKYRLERDGAGWRVEAWDFEDPPTQAPLPNKPPDAAPSALESAH